MRGCNLLPYLWLETITPPPPNHFLPHLGVYPFPDPLVDRRSHERLQPPPLSKMSRPPPPRPKKHPGANKENSEDNTKMYYKDTGYFIDKYFVVFGWTIYQHIVVILMVPFHLHFTGIYCDIDTKSSYPDGMKTPCISN